MSQFQFNMIMLIINAVVAFYFVRIFAKQIVSYEDYEGQFTMMTQYLSAIRTSLQSQEGRSQTAFALMRLYIIPILVACLPSIAHITLVGTSNVTDIISMVIFILLFGSLAWLTSRLITSNRIWLPRRFFNTIVHNPLAGVPKAHQHARIPHDGHAKRAADNGSAGRGARPGKSIAGR
ncbi:hypothetical protein [Secundilactobacillus paracollinoides]|uniref:hypothetical protein n=1 Tax=Secundilactobacillus paracollinoides TaxID=240427 RepID=UPI0006D1B19C|nr:hypothetical protein [Secundilactobacillus paracollinoides]KRL79127.1 hypothetical protein FC17_GL000663 [Secundilactobacillus paracollinoides DSM 15502 = JCM 11969]